MVRTIGKLSWCHLTAHHLSHIHTILSYTRTYNLTLSSLFGHRRRETTGTLRYPGRSGKENVGLQEKAWSEDVATLAGETNSD